MRTGNVDGLEFTAAGIRAVAQRVAADRVTKSRAAQVLDEARAAQGVPAGRGGKGGRGGRGGRGGGAGSGVSYKTHAALLTEQRDEKEDEIQKLRAALAAAGVPLPASLLPDPALLLPPAPVAAAAEVAADAAAWPVAAHAAHVAAAAAAAAAAGANMAI
jgi:hypothetical protein